MRFLFRPIILGLIGIIVLGAGAIYINTFFPFWSFVSEPASRLYQRLSFVSRLYDRYSEFSDLAGQLEKIKSENLALLSRLAELDRLTDENIDLRRVLNLPAFRSANLVDANISSGNFDPSGHEFVINRGSKDGVDVGYIAVAPEGFLVGIVEEVGLRHAQVVVILNPDISIAVRNIDSNVSGIARGALSDGMILDFVSQNDEINPGDLLVTNGSDQYPPGLIVGKVFSVASPPGELFKKIRVRTFLEENNFDRVILMEPR